MVSSEEIEKYIKAYSLEPHVAGSSIDRHFAKNIKSEWQKNGMDSVEIAEYNVLLSYPDKEKSNVVKIVNQNNDILTMESQDFQYLKSLGVPLEGKIFIARHWKLPADEIVWNAQDVKAAGLILYPDPENYNPPILKSDPYPKTWWLPPNVARTDSILWNGAGDPLTPGYPARYDANRLSINSATLPTVIVQPISYGNAYKLLSSLNGPEARKNGKGVSILHINLDLLLKILRGKSR
ncbi:glutamate carboxypeptidase 2 [Caerostris extrusa]|uniref:Glutamate carboxypeptidase 2 n=1 Tax=Caerostris extrusa TaxID=172846 RepID=A0AAV4WZM4_CAEEX|nr:glutamate carboxypeptidase 2 [Caerostris extrusa]